MTTPSSSTTRAAIAAAFLAFTSGASIATETARGIEQTLATAQQDKKGVTLYVAGQSVGGAVTRIEPGQWVELRNQQAGRIVVRLDRIDGVATN